MSASPAIVISVIVPVRNGESTLRAQLDALAGQIDAPPYEILVVDNGSDDGTRAVAEAWLDSGIGSAASARVIDGSARVGICFARNRGALQARGSILAYCDADDLVSPQWLSGARAGFEAGASVVTGRLYTFDREGRPTSEILTDGPNGIRTDSSPVRSIPLAWGCDFAVTREAFIRVGGFDESLPAYGCDDLDINLRLAREGFRLGYEPRMSVHYRQTRGVWKRVRRQYRSGVAQACVWVRHPDVYGRLPGTTRHVGRVFSDPARAMLDGPARLSTRVLAGMMRLGWVIGTIAGMRGWVRNGRLGLPRLLQPEDFVRPTES